MNPDSNGSSDNQDSILGTDRSDARQSDIHGSIYIDAIYCVVLGFACYSIGKLFFSGANSTPQQWGFAALVSVGASIPNLILMHSPFVKEFPAAAPLMATFWRGFVYVAFLVLGTATNWLGEYFSTICLQGCYFPYLALESALFMRRVRV